MRIPTCLALVLLCGCSHDSQQKMGGENPATATDQSNDPADMQVTKVIRQTLMDESTLSTAAKNVTVVTEKSVITLRGTVPNADELKRVESIVEKLAGARRVDSQITIKNE